MNISIPISIPTKEQISQCYSAMADNRKDIKEIIRFNEKLIDVLDDKIAAIKKNTKPSLLLVKYWTFTISLLETENAEQKIIRKFYKSQRKIIASSFPFISER